MTFLVIESRVQEPILPLSILRRRTLAGANTAGMLLVASFYAFLFIGTLYMQEVLHYSALQTGLAWLVASLASIALAGPSQLLVTRIGPKIVMVIGLSLIATGIIWATRAPVHGHFLADLAGPMAVAGAGTAFSFIPISIAALSEIEDRRAGLASGLLNTSQQLGGAIGIAMLQASPLPTPACCRTPAPASPQPSPEASSTRSGCSQRSPSSRSPRSSCSSAATNNQKPTPSPPSTTHNPSSLRRASPEFTTQHLTLDTRRPNDDPHNRHQPASDGARRIPRPWPRNRHRSRPNRQARDRRRALRR